MNKKKQQNKSNPLDQSDEIYYLQNFQEQLMDNIILRGIKNIDKVLVRNEPRVLVHREGKYELKSIGKITIKGIPLAQNTAAYKTVFQNYQRLLQR